MILVASQSSVTFTDFIVPLAATIIGGVLAFLGSLFQSKRAERQTKEARRRELSIESARNLDIQLLELEHVLHDYVDYQKRSLKTGAYEKIALICTALELHRRYIDDDQIQQAVSEAILFLNPNNMFDISPDESTATVTKKIIKWLRPMIQAHIIDETLPPEPEYIETYRLAYKDGKQREERFWNQIDQASAPKDE